MQSQIWKWIGARMESEIMMLKLEIANRIREMRIEKGWTQSKLATTMNVKRETVSFMESGSSLTVDNLFLAAHALGVSFSKLMVGKTNAN
jgi:transcriptional regulator with XRE-family HTH domain